MPIRRLGLNTIIKIICSVCKTRLTGGFRGGGGWRVRGRKGEESCCVQYRVLGCCTHVEISKRQEIIKLNIQYD